MKIFLSEILPLGNTDNELINRMILEDACMHINPSLRDKLKLRYQKIIKSNLVIGDQWYFEIEDGMTTKIKCYYYEIMNSRYLIHNLGLIEMFLGLVEHKCSISNSKNNHYLIFCKNIFHLSPLKSLLFEKRENYDESNKVIYYVFSFTFFVNQKESKFNDEHLFELGQISCRNLIMMYNKAYEILQEFMVFFITEAKQNERIDINNICGFLIDDILEEYLKRNMLINRDIIQEYVEFVYYLWINNFGFLQENKPQKITFNERTQ